MRATARASGHPGWSRFLFAAFLAASLALTSIGIFRLSGEVRRQIDELATANSDSTQWSLAQADVELLALKAAIVSAAMDSELSLNEVRRRFDIFYSRSNILMRSPVFAVLRTDDEVTDALARIGEFRAAAAPLIDSDDVTLRAGLWELADRTEAIRPEVRKITLKGVNMLSRQADEQRLGIAETLRWVSVLTIGLLFVLVFMLALLLRSIRRTRDRAREQSRIQSRLAAIVSTSLDAIVVVDRDGRVLDFNGAAERVFGYTRTEAIGSPMQDLIVPEHMKHAHSAGMQRYRATGERRVIGKGRVKLEAQRKNGEVFPVELSISTAASGEGEIFVSFIRDISHRVAAEKELIQARDDAVAGERAKADLIAVMSHEMRTPLNGMLGTLELLDTDRYSLKEREYLEIIRASGKLLLHHVDNVLEISRAEAGKLDLRSEPFSLGVLVGELIASQRSVAEHRGNTLRQRVAAGDDDRVTGDPIRVRQILLNLIGNAVKFTRNGSIDVEAERLGSSDLVEFRVRDTGIGIPKQDQERIFEDFVTLDASYTRAVGGTGLGLGIVKRFVEAMGGEIGVTSEDGEGSLFWIRLPLPPARHLLPVHEKATAGELSPAEHAQRPSLEVLVVEDNRINRVVVRGLLEQEGHKVDEAHDGQQGVEMTRLKSYDVVLMDISMPVLDGVEATRAIRASESGGRHLPIIALTAHAMPSEAARFRAAGLNDILVKPISRDALRRVLENSPSREATKRIDEAVGHGSEVDHAHLEELAESIGQPKITTLIEEFLIEMDASVDCIARGIEQGVSGDAIRPKVHHAAGSSALLGAKDLRVKLNDLEDRLAADTGLDKMEAEELRRIWTQTAPGLRRYLGTAASAAEN